MKIFELRLKFLRTFDKKPAWYQIMAGQAQNDYLN